MQKPPEKLWALVLQTNLGSKNLFFKSFLPLCSVVLPSGEEIWCLLLFLEFHLLESWEYCRPQLSEHKRYISSIDRWRKSRKSLWICKQSKLKQAPYCKSFFRPNIFLTCLMAFEIWAVTSNLLKGGGEIEKKYALKPRLSSCYWWNTKKYRNINWYCELGRVHQIRPCSGCCGGNSASQWHHILVWCYYCLCLGSWLASYCKLNVVMD